MALNNAFIYTFKYQQCTQCIHSFKYQKSRLLRKKADQVATYYLSNPHFLPDLPVSCTGKSFSEVLISASTNPQYDKRLSSELLVQYMKIPSSEQTKNNLCAQHVLLMFSSCSPHVLSLEFSCTELVIQWIICCHIGG